MYFEIWKNDTLIKRGSDLLNYPSWSNELMVVPSTMITIPITYHEFLEGRPEVKVFVDDKCFWGIVSKIEEDKSSETIDVDLEHIVTEWTHRQISVNNAIKDKKVNVIYKGAETNTENGVSVSASPFDILLEEVGTFTSDKYISRAGATAWEADGDKLSITVKSKVEPKKGDYDVTFTSNGVSVTVKGTVLENENKTEKDDHHIEASDFSVFADDVGKLTAEDYIRRANATSDLLIQVDYSNVKSSPGTYRVEFSATYEKDGEEQEIKVSVQCIVEGQGGEPSIVDNLADIYADRNFAYKGWKLNMSAKAKATNIDYVYSRQNKLDALTKTMELTPDLFWRVRFVNEKVIDIGEFGAKKEYIFSTKPEGAKNIRLISEPRITHIFDKVINVATVYSEKSDSGMSSMTLREVYENPELQESGFPVVILRGDVNNERDYRKYSTFPKLGPNNELEYAVIDEEGVALESGRIVEGSFAFNDLAPFNVKDENGNTQEVTDADRVDAAVTAYNASIKKLKASRRRYENEFDVTPIPVDLNVGDMVRLLYDNTLLILDSCSKYEKHILSLNDWFYLTEIDYDEVYTVKLEKYLRTERDITEE